MIVYHFNQVFTFTLKIEVLQSYLMVMLGPHDPQPPLKSNVYFRSPTTFRVSIYQDFHNRTFSSTNFLQQSTDLNYQSHDGIEDWLESYYSKRFPKNGNAINFLCLSMKKNYSCELILFISHLEVFQFCVDLQCCFIHMTKVAQFITLGIKFHLILSSLFSLG